VNHDLYGEFILSEVVSVNLQYPSVTINVLSHQTEVNPPNGRLEAVVEGNNEAYTFQWEDVAVPLFPLESYNSPIAEGLVAGPYTVVVTSIESGCTTTKSAIILDLTD
jgi:hypothetical protein